MIFGDDKLVGSRSETHRNTHTCAQKRFLTLGQKPFLTLGSGLDCNRGLSVHSGCWSSGTTRPPSGGRRRRAVSTWLTAAIPMDNPYCSCKLTRVRSRCRPGRTGNRGGHRRPVHQVFFTPFSLLSSLFPPPLHSPLPQHRLDTSLMPSAPTRLSGRRPSGRRARPARLAPAGSFESTRRRPSARRWRRTKSSGPAGAAQRSASFASLIRSPPALFSPLLHYPLNLLPLPSPNVCRPCAEVLMPRRPQLSPSRGAVEQRAGGAGRPARHLIEPLRPTGRPVLAHTRHLSTAVVLATTARNLWFSWEQTPGPIYYSSVCGS